MSIVERIAYEPMVGDPDDHRPETTWALVVDPETAAGDYVRDLTLLFERCAVGDSIPLHTHPIDEVSVIGDGEAEVRVGDERRKVAGRAVVFIPAGQPHGTRNTGDRRLDLQAIFASSEIGITYLERNPAPGTEADAPQPPLTLDARAEG